jgi:N-methylhydantoinase A
VLNGATGGQNGRYRIACDIGGTFTDIVLLDVETGEFHPGKLLTDSQSPADSVVRGIEQALAAREAGGQDVAEVVHASTLAGNLILERKTAVTGLLTTRGFRDILEMRRQERYDMYDLQLQLPEPLVPRRLRKQVSERVASDGSVLTPIDLGDVDAAVEELLEAGVDSIAVSYLHGDHERATAERIATLAPQLSVSLSSEVLPEIREYERTSTTVVDACIKPDIVRYLEELATRLEGLGVERLQIMLSGGGVAPVETAQSHPVRMIESGPSAGVLAAQHYASLLGLADLVALDIGGTTAKAGLVLHGAALKTNTYEIDRVQRLKKGSGIPVQLPAIELVEIGAGGGSIARVDALGFLEVGPDSAGADPGPVSYGRGGTEPTVSDADLVLGYLDPDYFLGGEMPLFPAAATAALEERIGGRLGLTAVEAAKGIHELVNEKMASAVRMHCLENGEDPARLTLVASGGAGPVHAYGVARKLGMERVIIPPMAGTMSAVGLLAADQRFDAVRMLQIPLSEATPEALRTALTDMSAEAARVLDSGAGIPAAPLASADMRYVGQGFEIAVPLEFDGGAVDTSGLRDAFHETYERLYGHHHSDAEIEILSLRLTARLASKDLGGVRRSAAQAGGDVPETVRELHFAGREGPVQARVYARAALAPGDRVEGPALIRDPESTIVVGPDAAATLDEWGGVSLTLPSRGVRQ